MRSAPRVIIEGFCAQVNPLTLGPQGVASSGKLGLLLLILGSVQLAQRAPKG